MTATASFNRLILRVVLRNVSPMVIRVISVPDFLDLPDFDELFRTVLGWDGLGFIFQVYGPGVQQLSPGDGCSCSLRSMSSMRSTPEVLEEEPSGFV